MHIHRLPAFACAFLIALFVGAAGVHAQNQAFTYQGKLDNGSTPATGPVDLVIKLFSVDAGGSPIGTQSINGVPLIGGVFTVTLNSGGQFSANPFATGTDRWVEITVNGTTLAPRQKLSVAPMAAFSAAPWVLSGTDLSYTAGKVGIGTASPDRPLALNEASTFGPGNRAAQLMSFQTDQSTRWYLDLLSPNGPSSTNYGLNFAESGSSDFRLFLASGGNIGIGTATPSGRVEIASANDALVIRPPTMVGGNVASIAFKDPDDGTPAARLNYKDSGYPNLSLTSSVSGFNARLGINTTDPAVPLDVRGEIAFGPAGQYSPAASGSGAIRMVYAAVAGGDGSLYSGSGLTVTRTGVGRYTVTFTSSFTSIPAVSLTPISISGGTRCIGISNLAPGFAMVSINTTAGAAVDEGFTVIAVGAR